MMKRAFALLLVLALLCLCACGEDVEDTVPACTHLFADAGCTTPRICTRCGTEESGDPVIAGCWVSKAPDGDVLVVYELDIEAGTLSKTEYFSYDSLSPDDKEYYDSFAQICDIDGDRYIYSTGDAHHGLTCTLRDGILTVVGSSYTVTLEPLSSLQYIVTAVEDEQRFYVIPEVGTVFTWNEKESS